MRDISLVPFFVGLRVAILCGSGVRFIDGWCRRLEHSRMMPLDFFLPVVLISIMERHDIGLSFSVHCRLSIRVAPRALCVSLTTPAATGESWTRALS